MSVATDMKTALETALSSNVGTKSITVDGQTIQFNSRKEMREELVFWENRVTAETTAVTRKKIVRAKMNSAFS